NAVEEIGAVSAGGTAAGLDSVIEPDSALTDDSISDSVDVVSSLSEPSKPTTTDDASTADISLWDRFIVGLIRDYVAFLMPCIYPMVPLTTSYFTKQSGSRKKGIWNAVIYGLSIIIIYVGLGMVITLIFGASALNEAASSATFNLLFFVLILVFAISFLGAFEITLPSRFVNKMDQKSDRGGLIGIFFMAFTLALVSF